MAELSNLLSGSISAKHCLNKRLAGEFTGVLSISYVIS